MKITDIEDHHKQSYFYCLEEWSDEMKESGTRKSSWYEIMKNKGLRIKLAVDDNNNVTGMIQYMPIEETHVSGKDLYFIYCIWVHGHKQGVGNFQKKGVGTLLLESAENDALSLGAKGMAAWGLSLPFWMKESWFIIHGYKKADKNGLTVLLWKTFTDNITPPKWIKRSGKIDLVKNKVTITYFINGWCPAQNIAYERAKRASDEFKDKVIFNEINTLDKDNLRKWGIVDGLFIDGKQIQTGPPPSYDKIKKIIEKKIKKLK
jgi:N-acetylglutamate synthase-like GNAT family acetyltransferase